MVRASSLLLFAAVATATLTDDQEAFALYKQKFNKAYSSAEEAHKFECFQASLRRIDAKNAASRAQFKLNKFSDLCADEFRTRHNLTVKPRVNAPANVAAPNPPVNVTVDWRKLGAVTHIKDQGQCGSCWAFSAVGNMEGQHFLAKGALESLSEEEIVQCSTNGQNQGCNGGLMDDAFDWVIMNKGIDSEKDYPYTSDGGSTGRCNAGKLKNVVATFTSKVDLPNDEDQMALWLEANGPISVAVDASDGWQDYDSGIMSGCMGTDLDHGVLIVGAGCDKPMFGKCEPYWIVKNSWGTDWGESGYIRLERGSNQCGIKLTPSSARV